MSKQLYTVSKEGLDYLCGLINKIVTLPSDVISDITLSTNKTMSSVKIDKIIKQCLQDANEYSNEVVNSLTHLVAEKIDFEPTLDNTTDKINTLLLYSANSDNNYTQYLRLTNELLNLGDTSLSLNEYMKEVDADTKYTLKTTTDTLTTEVTNIKSDFNTHKDDTDIHTSADEKASYVKKTDITTTIDSTSTDDTVPSAKAVNNTFIKKSNTADFYNPTPKFNSEENYKISDQVNSYIECKNGWVFIALPYINAISPIYDVTILIEGLPQPRKSFWGETPSHDVKDGEALQYGITTSGNFQLSRGTAGANYRLVFSYPVAE